MPDFPSDYEEFIYKSRYARWLPDERRRENWIETVDRYIDFMVPTSLGEDLRDRLREKILRFETMPSMRALMTAGPALNRTHVAAYNCSYLPIDDLRAFDEVMFILLCGTGVGFSVERRYTEKMPVVPVVDTSRKVEIVVEDSKEGWALAFRQVLQTLYDGRLPVWDVSKVRPAGARLRTFGGRASGPGPLVELFQFAVDLVLQAQGRRLRPIECHDLVCKVGEIVVVGGVRRSAMISLSDLDDEDMARAKSGSWWEDHPERALANNSAVYEATPDAATFSAEWASLIASRSGERGIFNRAAARDQVLRTGRRDPNHEFGTNPCSEIILRPYGFCNLSEVIVRAEDTIETLRDKVEVASILGTLQSNLTRFDYLRPIWRHNAEQERLLGVSLTGLMDHPVMNGSHGRGELVEWLEDLKAVAVDTNRVWANRIGINPSTAVTCVKPSGTVSQLTNSASGIHARHARFYLRSVRGDNKDPLTRFMQDQGVPCEPCAIRPETTTVFYFPIEAPPGSITRHDKTAIEQLEHWLIYQDHWCEHKPSVTVSVRDEEWMEVGAWVFRHFDRISGVSFLPVSDHVYKQAPYQDLTEEQYRVLKAAMPAKIDWACLTDYEEDDQTKGVQSLACSAGVCEIVDI